MENQKVTKEELKAIRLSLANHGSFAELLGMTSCELEKLKSKDTGQKIMGRLMGMTQQAYSRIETGARKITVGQAACARLIKKYCTED